MHRCAVDLKDIARRAVLALKRRELNPGAILKKGAADVEYKTHTIGSITEHKPGDALVPYCSSSL